MSTRKIKDAKDLETGEKIYLKGHAKATYMSDGLSVEDAIKDLQENGGGSGGGTAELMVNVTYDELVALRDNSQLVPGQKYRMTDYETTTSTAGTQSAGHPFDLILTAIGVNALDEKCSAIHSARDTEGYFANSKLEAWEVNYCLDNDNLIFSWAVGTGRFLTANIFDMYMNFLYNGRTELYGTEYSEWSVNLEGEELLVYTISDNPSAGDEVLFDFGDGEMFSMGEAVGVSGSDVPGKGVIYRLVDERGNDLSYDFKNIMFTRKLTDGELDLENGVDSFVYTFHEVDDNGNFVDASIYIESVHGNVIGAARPLVYNMLNDSVFFGTCYGNVIARDFVHNTCMDGFSSNRIEESCDNNVFGKWCDSNVIGSLFEYNTIGRSFTGNIVEGYFMENTIGDNCSNNRFFKAFTNNNLVGGCNYNSFGLYFSYSTLGKSSSNNTFGSSCSYLSLGSISSSSFGNSCEEIEIRAIEDPYYGGEPGTYIQATSKNLHFGDGCKDIRITYQDVFDEDYFMNYSFAQGLDKRSTIEVTGVMARNYETKVAMNSRGELKVYCEADLVN